MSLRNRRMTVAVAVALVVALLGAGCTKNPQAAESARLINNERTRRGIRTAKLDVHLVNKAQNWAEHMARTGKVSHSVLSAGIGGNTNWRYLAENVVGPVRSVRCTRCSWRAPRTVRRSSTAGTHGSAPASPSATAATTWSRSSAADRFGG
jgi:hypothetical protein